MSPMYWFIMLLCMHEMSQSIFPIAQTMAVTVTVHHACCCTVTRMTACTGVTLYHDCLSDYRIQSRTGSLFTSSLLVAVQTLCLWVVHVLTGVSFDLCPMQCRDYVNPYIPVAPQGIDPSLAVGITNPGGPNPMEGNVLLCSVPTSLLLVFTVHHIPLCATFYVWSTANIYAAVAAAGLCHCMSSQSAINMKSVSSQSAITMKYMFSQSATATRSVCTQLAIAVTTL